MQSAIESNLYSTIQIFSLIMHYPLKYNLTDVNYFVFIHRLHLKDVQIDTFMQYLNDLTTDEAILKKSIVSHLSHDFTISSDGSRMKQNIPFVPQSIESTLYIVPSNLVDLFLSFQGEYTT